MLKKIIHFFLIGSLFIGPVLNSLSTEQLSAQEPQDRTIIIHKDVGEYLDKEEAKKYGIFRFWPDLVTVGIKQKGDDIFILEIISEQDRIKITDRYQVPGYFVVSFLEFIDQFNNLTTEDKNNYYSKFEKDWQEITKSRAQANFSDSENFGLKSELIRDAEARARALAGDEWSRERWVLEKENDYGDTYQNATGILGFTIGAVAGIIIGHSLQKRKVVRTSSYSSGGWGGTEVTEHYKYENRYAPHIGGLIGGFSGALIGAYSGKQKDKQFYLLVPRDVRGAELDYSRAGNYLLGFGIIGPGLGWLSGKMLYAPSSLNTDESNFSPAIFLLGYLGGSVLSTGFLNAYSDRNEQRRRWEKSLLQNPFKTPLSIHILPLNKNTFSYYTTPLQDGSMFSMYQWQLLQVWF